MHRIHRTRIRTHAIGVALSALIATLAAGAAQAQTQLSQDGVAVVTGGVGADEDAAIKRMAGQYPLRLVISGRGGDYYVAQDFKLMKGDEVVLSLPSAGPWVLADLPPGRYAVQGVFDGELQSRAFSLPAAGTTVHWVLPLRLD